MSRVARTKTRAPAMQCPHCASNTDIRTSKEVTAIYREIRYRCQNDECGYVFVASLEAIRTVVPSARPNPEIRLPFLFRGKLLTPANDGPAVDLPPPANDDIMNAPG